MLFVLFLLCGVLGLIAPMGDPLRNSRVSGLAGIHCYLQSYFLISGPKYYATFVNPMVAMETPQLVENYGAGATIGLAALLLPATGVLFIIGYVMFSVDLLRSRQLGRGAPVPMIIGVVVCGAGLSGFLPMFVVQTGSILFGLATAWLGYQLIQAACNKKLPATVDSVRQG